MQRTHFRQLELGFLSIMPTATLCALVQKAEARGIRRVWLAENYHARSAMVQAAAVGAATREVEIGFSVLNPFTRHPSLIAMEMATLEELAGPRFLLGLGVGLSPLKAYGQTGVRGVAALKEAGEICSRLLAGERVVYEGRVFRLPAPGVQLGFPLVRRRVPLYYGTLGPRSLRMAARTADGIFFSLFCSPRFVEEAMEHVRAGAADTGRSVDDLDVACYVVFAVDEDGEAARRAARSLIGFYLLKGPYPDRMPAAGLSAELVASVRERLLAAEAAGRSEEACLEIPDEMVAALAVAGTPEECVAGLRAYAAAGVTTPVLYHVLGPDPQAAIDVVVDRLQPELVIST